jgi:predicted GIY-YIG superfamily endonuclease
MAAESPRGWTVYLLRCADGSLYAGITVDLAARVETHNAGRGVAVYAVAAARRGGLVEVAAAGHRRAPHGSGR